MHLARSALCLLSCVLSACAQMPSAALPYAFAHPIFAQPFSCMEHWAGNLPELGDALGTDCVVQDMVEAGGRTWMRSYREDGRNNEDWFGWHKQVLSPCTCTVVSVRENRTTNLPGVLGKPPASSITLRQSDGTHFVLAHVVDVTVKVGDSVRSGQALARVGNNGYSRHPHIHLGAWRDSTPLQVRFDQDAMGKLFE